MPTTPTETPHAITKQNTKKKKQINFTKPKKKIWPTKKNTKDRENQEPCRTQRSETRLGRSHSRACRLPWRSIQLEEDSCGNPNLASDHGRRRKMLDSAHEGEGIAKGTREESESRNPRKNNGKKKKLKYPQPRPEPD